MFHRVVVTSGTSLFAKPNLGSRWVVGPGAHLVEVVGRQVAPRGDSAEVLEKVDRAWADPPPVTDEKQVSAEYSALAALRRSGRLANEPDVVLIHSATFDGEAAALAVKRLIERDFGARVTPVSISGMDVSNGAELRRSLGAFMHELARALRAGEPSTTVFAPLGGFKVMTSFGYLTGAYCRYPSVYLHEDGQALHFLPWVPIQLDEAELRRLAPLARRALRYVRWNDLSHRERALVDEHGWLFERDRVEPYGEVVVLNAFGEFLAKEPAYRDLFRTRVLVAEDDAALVRAHREAVRRDVKHLLGWLPFEHTDHRGELHHEKAFGHHDARYALYKHGASALRFAWRYERDDDALYLRRIWTAHDDYEREAQRGDVLRSEPASWVDQTETVGAA